MMLMGPMWRTGAELWVCMAPRFYLAGATDPFRGNPYSTGEEKENLKLG